MVFLRGSWRVPAILLGFAVGAGPFATTAWAQPAPDAMPPLEGPVVGEQPSAAVPTAPLDEPPLDDPALSAPLHDVLRTEKSQVGPERAPKSPPPAVVERPSTARPDPLARWYGGYWSWDQASNDFVWVSGTWRVPQPGSIWVDSRWLRDDKGWYRTPGFWSQRQEPRAAAVVAPEGDWRITGPPADRPAETPGLAPGPNSFFVPGQYVPEADRVVWKRGFWAEAQVGWDWVPARWIQRADGWQYREGYWARDPGAVRSEPRRHTVARPSDFPAAIVESEPAINNSPSNDPNEPPAAIDSGSGSNRDVIADAERDAANPPPVVVVPRGNLYVPVGPPVVGYGYRGMPYRMIRPPSPVYGPAGVVVPDAVPPFVQRLLNRVLP